MQESLPPLSHLMSKIVCHVTNSFHNSCIVVSIHFVDAADYGLYRYVRVNASLHQQCRHLFHGGFGITVLLQFIGGVFHFPFAAAR